MHVAAGAQYADAQSCVKPLAVEQMPGVLLGDVIVHVILVVILILQERHTQNGM